MLKPKKILVIGFDCLIDKLVKMYEPFHEKKLYDINYLSMQRVDYLSGFYSAVKLRTSYGNIFSLIWQILKSNKKSVNHIEVYFDSAFLALLTILICRIKSIPVVGVCRGSEVSCLNEFNFRRKFLLTQCFLLADKLLLKEIYMSAVLEKLSVPKQKFQQIHNVLPENFDFSLSKFSVNSQEFLYLNSIRKMRNVYDMVKAFHRVNKSNPEARLTIIGLSNDKGYSIELDYEKTITDYIKVNSLQQCIRLIPFTKDAWRHVNKCRAYILYADIIWLNNSMLEACAYGLPLIIPNEDGADEFEGASFIVDRHNVDALEKAMLQSLADNDASEAKSQQAKKIASNKFSFKGYFKKQLDFYQSL